MRLLKIAAFAFVMLTAFAAFFGTLLPSRWHTERAIVVRAPPAAIYPLVASFRTGWPQWSPFGTSSDPKMRMSFSGPDEGVGAAETWSGGSTRPGSLRMVRADPNHGVAYKLELEGGLHIEGALTFAPDAGGTKVTWTDDGDLGANPFRHYAGKQIEESIGKGFEQGLAALKQKAEAAAGR